MFIFFAEVVIAFSSWANSAEGRLAIGTCIPQIYHQGEVAKELFQQLETSGCLDELLRMGKDGSLGQATRESEAGAILYRHHLDSRNTPLGKHGFQLLELGMSEEDVDNIILRRDSTIQRRKHRYQGTIERFLDGSRTHTYRFDDDCGMELTFDGNGLLAKKSFIDYTTGQRIPPPYILELIRELWGGP